MEKKKEIESKISYSRVLKLTSPLMYGEDVKAVQNKLNGLGYNSGTVDGYYGNNTMSAVKRFQSAKGLLVDGMVGTATWNKLFSSSSGGGANPGYTRVLKVMSPLMYGEDIRKVQSKLNSKGYNAGNADGYYGGSTERGVKRYQSNNNLASDGMVGPITWNKLFTGDGGKGIYAYHGDINYVYGILTLSELKRKAQEFGNARDKGLSTTITDMTSLFSGIMGCINKWTKWGYIGLAAGVASIFINISKNGYTHLYNLFTGEMINQNNNVNYFVIRATSVFHDNNYSQHNPKPATSGKWNIHYGNIEFVYRSTSKDNCEAYLRNKGLEKF